MVAGGLTEKVVSDKVRAWKTSLFAAMQWIHW